MHCHLELLSPPLKYRCGHPAGHPKLVQLEMPRDTGIYYYVCIHAKVLLQRIHFKVATFVHQSLSGISPSYLADDCRLVADARERRLHSTASQTCVVTRTFSTFGDRAFSAAGPGLWNSLPSHLKDADLSYNEFRLSLKTFLFGQWATAQCELY